MVAIERLEGVIGVGPVVSGGTAAERRVAFVRFSQERLERAYRLASVILRDGAEAEDAVHDAAVQAWLHWAELRDRERMDAWFDRIVVNACRAQLRRRTIRPLPVDPADPPGSDPFAGVLDADVLIRPNEKAAQGMEYLVVIKYEGNRQDYLVPRDPVEESGEDDPDRAGSLSKG